MGSELETVDGATSRSRFRLELPAEPASVPQIRHALTTWARGLGIDDEALGSIRLAVTEAVANAVVHAYVDQPAGAGVVIVEGRPARDALVVRVTDRGSGIGPRADSPGLGMGLPLIGRLCSHVDLTQGADGTGSEVRMTFATPGLQGPAAARGDGTLDEILAVLARAGTDATFGGQDIGSLADLLVPRLADLCSVTLLDASGRPQRVGARVARADGTIDDEAGRWVLEFPLTATSAPSSLAAFTGEPQVVVIDDAWIDAVSPDERRAGELRALGLAWWASVPLQSGRTPVGSLSLAGRSGEVEEAVAAATQVAEHAQGLVATARLVDELRRTRRRLERILGALTDAVTVTEPDGRVVYANDAAVALLGARDQAEMLAAAPGELAGRFRITDQQGAPVALSSLPNRQLTGDGREAASLLTRSVHLVTGRTLWVRTSSGRLDDDGPLAVNVMQDVTAETEAQHRHRFLADLGAALGSTLELDETLRRIAGLAVPTLADWCTIDLLDEGTGDLERVALHHADRERVTLGAHVHQRHPPDLASGRGLAKVLRDGVVEHVQEITDAMLEQAADDPQHLNQLRSFGLRSAALLPMTARGRTLGVLSLLTAESARTLTAQDVVFAGDVASRAAMAVDNARLFAQRDR